MSDYDGVDWSEAGRMAHEIGLTHGHSALQFATKRMQQNKEAEDVAEYRFWKAVVAELTPRDRANGDD